jgi:hypothetical protein
MSDMTRQQNTTSLCDHCFAEIPAVANPFGESPPMLYKVCPEHGIQRAVLEADGEFYTRFNTYERNNHYPILIVNVTDRCNIQCPHCFYPVENKWDMSLDEFKRVVNHFRADFSGFIISGGDPTCWAEYFTAAEWCRGEGIMLSQLTNGVKFADPEYLDRVLGHYRHGKFLCAEISVHPTGYNTPAVREQQLVGLRNLRERGLKATCIMINIDPSSCSAFKTDTIMYEVIEFMQEWRDVAATFRLRPVCFGWASSKKPILSLSHLVKSLKRVTEARGLQMKYSKLKDVDNIYNNNFLVDGIDVVTVCAAPTVENIDISYMQRGPWMLANDGRPYAVPHALIVNEGLSKGWYRGKRLATQGVVEW